MTKNPSRSGPATHVAAVGPEARAWAGMIRRFGIPLTSRPFWQLVGHELLDGTPETHDAEVFSGIGFYARPPAGSKPEAIAVCLGGGGQPVVIATRDEQTRAAVAGSIAEGETAVYNASTISLHTAGGTIEHRSAGGGAGFLARKADLDAFMAALQAAITALGPGAPSSQVTALQTALNNIGFPIGTSVIKGE